MTVRFGKQPPAKPSLGLIEAGADIDARDADHWSPLELAILFGTPESIATLWTAGADISANEETGWTPLHLAAYAGSPENVTALLNAGADGALLGNEGESPFDLAKFSLIDYVVI